MVPCCPSEPGRAVYLPSMVCSWPLPGPLKEKAAPTLNRTTRHAKGPPLGILSVMQSTQAISLTPELLLDAIQDGVSILDRDLTIIKVNRWMEDKYPSMMPLAGKKCYAAYHNRLFPCPWCPCLPAMERDEPNSEVVPFSSGCGKQAGMLHITATPMRDESGAIVGVIEHVKDITPHRKIEEELQHNEQLSQTVLETTTEGFWLIDPQTMQTKLVNPALCAMLGYRAEEMLGRPPLSFVDEENARIFLAQTAQISTSKHRCYEITLRKKNGGPLPVIMHASTLWDSEGQASEAFAFVTDITERKQLEERISHLAQHDSLTGLPNRHLLLDRLGFIITSAQRQQTRPGVMFVDLDGFKEINDRFGHACGDLLMQQVASRLKSTTRASDTTGRLGGDEFIVILADVAETAAIRTIADKIITALAAPYRIDGQEIRIGASIGIARYPQDGTSSRILLQKADGAMYEAKRAGKNRCHFASPAEDDGD